MAKVPNRRPLATSPLVTRQMTRLENRRSAKPCALTTDAPAPLLPLDSCPALPILSRIAAAGSARRKGKTTAELNRWRVADRHRPVQVRRVGKRGAQFVLTYATAATAYWGPKPAVGEGDVQAADQRQASRVAALLARRQST